MGGQFLRRNGLIKAYFQVGDDDGGGGGSSIDDDDNDDDDDDSIVAYLIESQISPLHSKL